MALAAYARNIYAPTRFVDLNLVPIVITAAGRDTNRTAPEVSVGAGAAGVYAITMPAGQSQILFSREVVNAAAKTVVISAITVAGGVASFSITLSGGANAAGGEEIHVAFGVINQ